MTLLLSVKNVKKDFNERKILKDISFDIEIGSRIGLVGLNGAGKTTLVNIIAGKLQCDEGNVLWHKKSVNTGYFKQASANIKNLSGGERTKLALSEIWLENPDFLILDEPTNHLDYTGVQRLIKEIKSFKGTVLVISHDRYFLDETVNKILEIDEGIIHEYKGNYSGYRDEKKRRYEAQLNKYLNQQETKRKISEQINTLKNWSEKAHRESRKKAIASGNKFGGKEYLRVKAKKKDIQVKSRIKRLEKIEIEGVQKPKEEKKIDFMMPKAELKGRRAVEAVNISKSFENKLLFKESSFYIKRGEKIGVFGENGCGKTTLLKMLLGEEKADSGQIFISTGIKAGYFSQDITEIDIEKKVSDIFNINSKEERGRLQTLLHNMGFEESMLEQQIKTLSLGEITRLRITKLVLEACDLLILDEPLNHLDLNSREKLEEVLEDYDGTIILVAHDRYMLQRICSKLLVFENKEIKRVEGTLEEYLNRSKHTDGKSRNKSEEKLLIENEIAFVLGELSRYPRESDKYRELDIKFSKLLEKKKELTKEK